MYTHLHVNVKNTILIFIANMAWRIKRDDNYADPNFNYDHTYDAYYLKIVGEVPSGLNFIKLPIFEHNFLDVLRKAIPIALIAYMESYSVSRVIAAKRGMSLTFCPFCTFKNPI